MSNPASNVVQLSFPSRAQTRGARRATLLRGFAKGRRDEGDVYWLKENAEVLNIFECTGQSLPDDALSAHQDLYDSIEKRLGFFPQYYRFFLSICLDLEDLGMPGSKGQALVDWALMQDLPAAELSDLQRAEARRLMLRRGRDPYFGSDDLTERLHAFISRPATFVMPNKKAAYELTHTLFYLSEYGRKIPQLPERTKESLNFAGTLAYLDCNADLLAEICVAMRHAGLVPPQLWEDWLVGETHGFAVDRGEGGPAQDDYHEYLVSNWALATAGHDAFPHKIPEGSARFHARADRAGPLRLMSQCLLSLDGARSGDWHHMRDRMFQALGDDDQILHLQSAEESCTDFNDFFAGFARTNMVLRAS
ncbi:hypothetical protein DL237_01575 [Pseudooceanicola sediminis]|uniref:Uncharacterized protein n=1 Tax=Pseudooceanicola sediminis TaxID=2211117 RepID=A0A399JDM3_9RHOB|nr:hypothetical protein [Pseudooceanicola sediminis]KAA2316818.1 hypothetical protein E0K93_00345 [Puniceibacterium sp. HSS470]RII40726.1 hypothetical protein DL237_01575 [Pseudooceanicola sediminis]|tara:strand:- start:200136 stop:201227 length:1092 start_codon:yes stop_codon:yes gene_type:complete